MQTQTPQKTVPVLQRLIFLRHMGLQNGRAQVKEGTSAVLLQSGSDEKWWADPMECYCYLQSVQDLVSNGKTPHERRFGEPF